MSAASTSDERIILCMKWGVKYGPEYVNRLYAMVRRHLRGDFRFVCLTDRSEGIRAEVQCLPIPPLELPPGIPERGWTKLTTFEADLHGLPRRLFAVGVGADVVMRLMRHSSLQMTQRYTHTDSLDLRRAADAAARNTQRTATPRDTASDSAGEKQGSAE